MWSELNAASKFKSNFKKETKNNVSKHKKIVKILSTVESNK